MFEGYGPASRSMTFPAAITVQSMLAQHSAAAHMARTDARLTAVAGGDRVTRGTAHTSRPFVFGKPQPSSPSACRAAASRSVRHSA